ncbi:hypothetical protein OOK31_00295 [Streptomyces sp. NBC_00249]|uniref:hypothetical protein n=1 Tax=Streptomyces sp. NBC_00249 TaxID=2975690 RepID=UPI00224D75EA|nr:hypothetical protein [Streptomyces sp. NBC_00249]MCX5192342.1 hypothetical protein [Streptomyces sp. NBC_00249]
MTGRRRRNAKWVGAALAAAATVVLAAGGWYAYQLVSGVTGTLGVPCDQAAHALRAARLPDGTHDRRCTTGTWMSVEYKLDFRAPREATEAWLRSSYPDAELSDCAGTDACTDPQPRPVPFTDKDGHRLMDVVRIEVNYENGDIAHVRASGVTI